MVEAAHDPRTACAPTTEPFLWAARVQTMLSTERFDLTNEKATQAAIEAALLRDLAPDQVRREHRLGVGDIPDFFLMGAIVLEVKGPRHRAADVLRQLERYAAHPQVQVILLATARAMRMPNAFRWRDGRRVPVSTIELGRAWL